jgi:hypothetical protein
MIGAVRLLALSILIVLQLGCETAETDRYNRRDLYSPGPESGSVEAAPVIQSPPSPSLEPKPQFR